MALQCYRRVRWVAERCLETSISRSSSSISRPVTGVKYTTADVAYITYQPDSARCAVS